MEILPDRISGYDSYTYVGKEIKNFLNYPTDKIELIFNWEVLEIVTITFKESHILTEIEFLKEFQLIKQNQVFRMFKTMDIFLYSIVTGAMILYGTSDLLYEVLFTLL